ncbi:unnamed protein product, partial [Rotaria sp. Silwood2]
MQDCYLINDLAKAEI